MIKKLEDNLWEIKEKDFEAILDDKWLLLYINWYEICEKKTHTYE